MAVFNDAIAALASGTLGQLYGIALISGTGMIAKGYKDATTTQRAGGFGGLFDSGSGYSIGIAIVRAVMQANDGTAPVTSLKDALLTKLRRKSCDDLFDWIYEPDPTNGEWARFAALAPLAFEHEAKGDPVARQILVDAADALARCVLAVANKLNFGSADQVPIVLAGGILQNPTIANFVKNQVIKSLPRAVFLSPKVEPAVGAALVSLRSKL